MGVILALHPNNLINLYIATPIMAEGRKRFCFPETKKCDFLIFLQGMFNHRWARMNTDKIQARLADAAPFVAQVSKPAVSPISKSAGRHYV
jgi:hypothetical protein